jgi:hypothetical protein
VELLCFTLVVAVAVVTDLILVALVVLALAEADALVTAEFAETSLTQAAEHPFKVVAVDLVAAVLTSKEQSLTEQMVL